MIGFIFFEKSPRNVSAVKAAKLAEAARGTAKIVAVTVNAADDFLDEIVETGPPGYSAAAWVGTPERVAEIKARYGLPVIKAFAIRDAADLDKAGALQGHCRPFSAGCKGTRRVGPYRAEMVYPSTGTC